MAANVAIKNNKIIKLDKKNLYKRISKKIKKLIKYDKIKEERLKKKYKMVLGTIHIEFTSYCNLRCQMCPNNIETSVRGKGFMDVSLFKEKIVDYIVDNPQFNFGLLNLWQGGEALLHPGLREILEMLGKAKNDCKNFPQVNFLTNATILNEEKSKIIIDSEAIDEIYFSIDYGNKKDFEAMRVGAKWESTLNNIENFIDKNNKSDKKITTGILSITSLDEPNIFSPEFLELVRKVDYFHPRPAHNWEGSIDLNLGRHRLSDFTPKKGLCGRITNTLAVLWNGLVVPCCQDLLGRGVIGDLNKQTFYEIFNGGIRKKYIDLMRQQKREMIELCKNCSL